MSSMQSDDSITISGKNENIVTNVPKVSLTSIGNLSDLLKDLPLIRPIDNQLFDLESDYFEYDSYFNLIDNKQQLEKSNKLLSLTDPNFTDIINKTLSQIDTSKITLKSNDTKSKQFSQKKNLVFPPLLQTVLVQNQNIFNGTLNEQFSHMQLLHQKQHYSDNQTHTQQVNFISNENSNVKKNETEQGKNQIEHTVVKVNNHLDIQKKGFVTNPAIKSDQYGNSSSSYQVSSDPNKLNIKISKQSTETLDDKSNKNTINPKETIKASKFYSNPSDHSSTNKVSTNSSNNNSNSNSSINGTNKKTSQLSTWQADLKSQLSLPDDFTPELIQQLASEGYDVISAFGSRKARHNKQLQNQQQQKISDDSSDSDSQVKKSDVEYNPTKNKTIKNNHPNIFDQKITNNSDKNLFGIQRIQKQDLSGLDPSEHPSYKRFNQILEDLLETYEQDLQQMNLKSKNEKNRQNNIETESQDVVDEIPAEYLITRQVCADLVQEAFKLNTYSFMNLIKKENLFKLQNLLYFNIKDGIRSLNLMNEDYLNSTSEQDKILKEILVEKLMRASDCSIISLIIMTSPKISKELVVEDIIEQITIFIKKNLSDIIFPNYDPVYRPATSLNNESKTSKEITSKRKLLIQFQNMNSSSSKSSNFSTIKHINHFYNRMREILSLFSELITQIDLTDTIVITLTSLSVMCFFVENINDLQLEALKILTNLFTRYPKHRQLVLDDILSSLIKLHTSKRNSRSYKCFNGDSIQMFSALILQLIQSEVYSIDHDSSNKEEYRLNELSFEEKETYLLNSYDQSRETAKRFLTSFFSKCKIKHPDFDFRPIFENFIQDLLVTVNKPEWPVSEILLNLLGIILVSQIQNDQSDVQSRVNSLDYLGQIVSQLRKDSLEYQKYPEKIEKVLKKFKSDNSDSKELTIFTIQNGLISYINSLVSNDQSLSFSKYFLVSQWLKDLNQVNTEMNLNLEHGLDRVEAHVEIEQNRKKIYSLIEQKDNQCPILDPAEAFILSKYLSSLKKNLDKNFDLYLVNILNLTGGGSDANTPTQVRSKAIKCLSLIIEADPQLLLKPKVFSCVESNFLHQTISVREASVDLIGRFITIMPELTHQYYKLLSDRVLDVGVSVRKRVIKIFREICISQPNFEHLTEICVKILKRINDEDAIKRLVIDTFYSIWFSPVSSKELLLKRVLNLVDVVSEFSLINNPASMEIFESLFNSLIINQSSTSCQNFKEEQDIKLISNENLNEKEMLINRSKDVEKYSKKIVDCLIENVLNTEANMNSTPQAYKRLVACFATLYLFSKIKPDYFITHAETLLPYLNIKSTNSNDNQIINSAAKILECVVPLLQSPSNSFLISLEESLCKLIFQGGMMIVSSCISCLGTVVNKLTKNYKLAADCLIKFYNNSTFLKRTINPKNPLENNTKPLLFRVLFTLGLLSKHFDVESNEFKDFKICTKQDLFQTFIYFINNFDSDVQHKALIGLGSFLTRNSEYMIKEEVKCLYLKYIKGNEKQIPSVLKSQVFVNLTDYLNEEDQKNLAKSVELAKTHLKDDLKEMLDVQSGMASTIIQSYLKPILESYLTCNLALRISVFNCLSMILNQGLVYPIECVPYLIAMTTDNEKKIQTKALNHLTNLQKAHPNFVQSKSIAGINISFILHKFIKANHENSTNNSEKTVIRGFTDTNEILSLNHHLYSLLRGNRSYRRAFVQQLLKMFDDSSINRNQTNLPYMLFITDNLAYFPYQLLDEPLYLIHQIDLIISVTGINLLQTFKENLINFAKDKINKNELKSDDESKKQFEDIDLMSQPDCPDEEDDIGKIENQSKQLINSTNNNNSSSVNRSNYKSLDDDDETFENVLNNLPTDLKPLKECMYKAQGCCLLLILKQFLKEVYTINDSKIQNYSPTDTAKVNDRPLTSRKTNRKFNPKQIIDYMLNYENDMVDEESLKRSLVNEYLDFKELILSIDQEDMNKIDENKPNSKPNQCDTKLSLLQQKLFEGIEKVKVNTPNFSGQTSGQESAQATPKSKIKIKSSGRSLSSSAKKSSTKKRKRKKDSDDSSEDSDFVNSDFEDES